MIFPPCLFPFPKTSSHLQPFEIIKGYEKWYYGALHTIILFYHMNLTIISLTEQQTLIKNTIWFGGLSPS